MIDIDDIPDDDAPCPRRRRTDERRIRTIPVVGDGLDLDEVVAELEKQWRHAYDPKKESKP